MSDLGFFLGFFAIVVFLAITVGNDNSKGIFSDVSSSTPEYRESDTTDDTYTQPEPVSDEPEVPFLTEAEIEEKVADIYRELDELREDIRAATLREPVSPYRGAVTLRSGNVDETDPDREYLTLRVDSDRSSGINISRWYLQSYVTEESASIPDGDRIIEKWRSPVLDDIVLEPGETAYLITGKSPIDASFRENICTGYLAVDGDFTPSLNRSCPRPEEELVRFGTRVDLDDDDCYTFIESLGTCVTPEEEAYERSRVGGACSTFIENTFNHNDCVRLHRYDPFFDRDGEWRIYLGERNELWRSEREIIQLMDENDRVIDVVEY